jgi:hypothetical protein
VRKTWLEGIVVNGCANGGYDTPPSPEMGYDVCQRDPTRCGGYDQQTGGDQTGADGGGSGGDSYQEPWFVPMEPCPQNPGIIGDTEYKGCINHELNAEQLAKAKAAVDRLLANAAARGGKCPEIAARAQRALTAGFRVWNGRRSEIDPATGKERVDPATGGPMKLGGQVLPGTITIALAWDYVGNAVTIAHETQHVLDGEQGSMVVPLTEARHKEIETIAQGCAS